VYTCGQPHRGIGQPAQKYGNAYHKPQAATSNLVLTDLDDRKALQLSFYPLYLEQERAWAMILIHFQCIRKLFAVTVKALRFCQIPGTDLGSCQAN